MQRIAEHYPLATGKKVVLIEDGPTLTHGGMAYGAGKVRCAGALSKPTVCRMPSRQALVPACLGRHVPWSAGTTAVTQPALLLLPQYAADKYGAADIVDPRPYLVGSMLFTYKKVCPGSTASAGRLWNAC